MTSQYFDQIRSASKAATNLDQYLSSCEELLSQTLGAIELKIGQYDAKSKSLTILNRAFDTHTPGMTGKIQDTENPMIKSILDDTAFFLTSADLITRAFKEKANIWFEELFIEQLWLVPSEQKSLLIGFTDSISRLTDSGKDALFEIIRLQPTNFDLQIHNESRTVRETLTSRELKILELMAEAFSNKQIAKELQISESTVKQEIHEILEVLQVSKRTDAVKYYFNHFLIK